MQPGRRLQEQRNALGLTQAELARRAGVSRALVSAVEAGRHLPRVDAAIALATALGTSAETLFGGAASEPPVDALSGQPVPTGAPVRLARVGERIVTMAARHGEAGWDAIDGVAGDPDLQPGPPGAPQLVVAGCEPGLELLERLLRDRGAHALSIPTSSEVARAAFEQGRLHAAAVHFEEDTEAPPSSRPDIVRIQLARWRVGLAAPRGAVRGWWRRALAGEGPLIQRETEASAQRCFERARRSKGAGRLEGPRVATHLAATRLCVAMGLPAVTIEPAAAAVGATFHALETHRVELWLHADRIAEPGVQRLLEAIGSPAYRRTLESIGGYDLADSGRKVA